MQPADGAAELPESPGVVAESGTELIDANTGLEQLHPIACIARVDQWLVGRGQRVGDQGNASILLRRADCADDRHAVLARYEIGRGNFHLGSSARKQGQGLL